MTKSIKRIGDLFEYALYKFTLYLLTYLLIGWSKQWYFVWCWIQWAT